MELDRWLGPRPQMFANCLHCQQQDMPRKWQILPIPLEECLPGGEKGLGCPQSFQLAPSLTNVPLRSSWIAWRISSSVFMTNGP